jgi:AcrR family transcriptional regulator
MTTPTLSTRDRLTAAAAELFAERGYHGTSIGDLAQKVGIHKSSIYAHITGKEDLLAGLALAGAASFHAALDGLPAGRPAGERLRLAFRAHLGVVERQLDVATIWLREWRYLSGEARETFLGERRRYERRIRSLFDDARAEGALRSDVSSDDAALLFLSAANWAYTWMSHDTDVGAAGDRLWNVLWSGVRLQSDTAVPPHARRKAVSD